MRQPKVSSFWGLFRWLIGGMALVIVLSAIVAVITPSVRHPVRYTRYISPPRQDGTRYTFLYPAALGQPTAGGSAYLRPSTKRQYTIQSAGVQTHFSEGERWMKRTNLLRQLYPQNEEDVRVSSTDDTTQPDPFPAGGRTGSENSRYLRSETIDIGEGTGQHNVVVTDTRTGVRYYFQHSYWGPDTADSSASSFTGDDRGIAQSFRVLPPGTAPSGQPQSHYSKTAPKGPNENGCCCNNRLKR